ncbi:MAG: sigma-70 domain-containing protein, partial [Candidatus Puniceispirillum sp.]
MSNQPNNPVSENITRVARLDIAGGGQVTVQNGLAFVGHMDAPHGTTIIDVKDPHNPQILKQIMLEDGLSHTHKVRVAGNIMITNVEQAQRHLLRRGEQLPEVTKKLGTALGRAPSDAEIAAELGLPEAKLPDVRQFLENGYSDGGFRVWDIADPSAPELLAYVRTHGFGVHRFDMD